GEQPNAEARLRDYAIFARALAEKELPRLANAGVKVHLLPPGATREDGKLVANAEYPGVAMEYRTPGDNWQAYSGPVTLDETQAVWLRTRVGDFVSRETRLD